MKWFSLIAMVSTVVAFVVLIAWAVRYDAREAAAIRAFIEERQCQVVGFTSEAFHTYPIYSCDDGSLHIFKRIEQ